MKIESFFLTGLPLQNRTLVLCCEANIGEKVVRISPPEILKAILPMYPESENAIKIDLTNTPGSNTKTYYKEKSREITTIIQRNLYPSINHSKRLHLSVFALGPMPLLMQLGQCIGDAIKVDLYQRHRDTQDWLWKQKGEKPKYITKLIQNTDNENKNIALMLNLSGKNGLESLPPNLKPKFKVYEITLENQKTESLFFKYERWIGIFQETISRFLE